MENAKVNVGIIGSGTMGSGIAQVAAAAGHDVLMYDIHPEAISGAQKSIAASVQKLVEKNKISKEEGSALQSRIRPAGEVKNMAECGLIIEAIAEDAVLKKKIFRDIEKFVPADCILASNTSSISITSIASACRNPQRVMGIHFFNPAALMPLVEIIPGPETDYKILDHSKKIMGQWGKIPVVAKDTPGFIVNRIARPFYGEALRLLEEGIADAATIDYAMIDRGGFKMGPFELMDFIGNDINYAVTETVWRQMFFDPRYKPSLTQLRMVESGKLGRKSGKGYFDYSNHTAQKDPVKNPELHEKIFLRILSMLINEAAEALYYRIASKEDIELAMTKGVNYPKGLLKWADEIGISRVYDQLFSLQMEYGEERYRPSVLLNKMAKGNKNFFT